MIHKYDEFLTESLSKETSVDETEFSKIIEAVSKKWPQFSKILSEKPSVEDKNGSSYTYQWDITDAAKKTILSPMFKKCFLEIRFSKTWGQIGFYYNHPSGSNGYKFGTYSIKDGEITVEDQQ